MYHKGYFPVILRKQGPLSFNEITVSLKPYLITHPGTEALTPDHYPLKGLLRKQFEPLIPRKLFGSTYFISYVYFFSVVLLIVLLFSPTSLAAHILDESSPRNDTCFLLRASVTTLVRFQRFHSIDSRLDKRTII